MTGIDVIEQAIVDEFAGRIDRAEAITRVRAVMPVTEAGAVDLLDHPVSARARYARALFHPLWRTQ